jgi:putative SOS response-associated peptidase YedK
MRLAFYYPWFPRNWTQQGIYPYTNFTPSLNYYDSANLDIIKKHIAAMQYAKIEEGIVSWWGQMSEEDRNFSKLLTLAEGTTFKWCIYHELESKAKQPLTLSATEVGRFMLPL